MKIFSWVHRRFSRKDEKSGYDDDVHESINAFDPFDGWKRGVLTIGTFGYDPLKDEDHIIQQEDEEIQDKKHLLENYSSEEEVKPLMLAAYQHEGLMEMKMEGKRVDFNDIDFEIEIEVEGIKERTTLAQLFSADSQNYKHHPINITVTKGEIININHKNGFSLAKKLVANAPPRPIHKLHRLVRRMLKRKIHPDVGVNVNVADTTTSTTTTTTTESASLLSTQDAIVKLDG